MGKKSFLKIIVFVLLVQIICPNFMYADVTRGDTPQPAVCNSPSEMMQNYFDFQNEAEDILLGSDINSLRFKLSLNEGGLFNTNVLQLHSATAIDILATNVVGGLQSFVSNSVTSVVLLLLASASVVQSNVEGFSILFKDRPIVREYKQMLDIETALFDVAYFRSKQINLTRPFESNLLEAYNELIKKYQEKGLLESSESKVKDSTTMADILLDLISMNTAMKHFISWGGNYGKLTLRDFNGCAGSLDTTLCKRKDSVLKFSDDAISQLLEDYKDVRSFGKCNQYATSLKSTITKTINNNQEPMKTAAKDVKDAIERLMDALVGKGRWNLKDPCDAISDYEMAQLKAYWGPDWTCGGVNVKVTSNLLETRNYFKQKRAQDNQKEKNETSMKYANKPQSKDVLVGSLGDELRDTKQTDDREVLYRNVFGESIRFNPDFLFDLLNEEFSSVYEESIDRYAQDLEDGIAADASDILPRGKGVVDQIGRAITNTTAQNKDDGLNHSLQQIADYQGVSS